MYNKEYVEKNLIAYIGNKRRLIPLLLDSLKSMPREGKFLDLFAGTGVVSRLAKSLGYEVFTNDWEYYSYIINKAFIGLDGSAVSGGFAAFGGMDKAVEILNNLSEINEDDKYFSRYYSPEDDDKPDLENERLFYTRKNGLKIDMIRTQIENWSIEGKINDEEKTLLIALLLYDASTHSNTSGVFKGFHRGFGGTNGDALGRILKTIELKKPELISGSAKVFNCDAVKLSGDLKDTCFDIVYLDPPYNQHQYGSNYHILNTIALFDKPPVNKNVIINGKKINKSAIRKDWVKTKSTFCYKKSATDDFKKIIENLNCKRILISYSTDGIIPFNDILEILSAKGKLDIVMSEYNKYRGGKQAITTELKNIEFILTVDTEVKGSYEDIKAVHKKLIVNKMELLLKKTMNPMTAETLGFEYKNRFDPADRSVERTLQKRYDDNNVELFIEKNRFINIEKTINLIKFMPFNILTTIYRDLEDITNLTKEDELNFIIKEMNNSYAFGRYDEVYEMFKSVPYLLSKFNNKKAYLSSLNIIKSLLDFVNLSAVIWVEHFDNTYFGKLDKIILIKLNVKSYDAVNEIKSLKTAIGEKYDRIAEKIAIYKKEAKKDVKLSVKIG